jgi:hypothetical protein
LQSRRRLDRYDTSICDCSLDLALRLDDATLDAQFLVFEVRGKERPATGWPEGAFGAQGTVQPIEAGYYRPVLRRAGMSRAWSNRFPDISEQTFGSVSHGLVPASVFSAKEERLIP